MTEPIVKALGEPAMPLTDTVSSTSATADAGRDAIDVDFVIALALGRPDEIDASIPDELPSFEQAPTAFSMELPLAKINPFREPLASADAQHVTDPVAPLTSDAPSASIEAIEPVHAIEASEVAQAIAPDARPLAIAAPMTAAIEVVMPHTTRRDDAPANPPTPAPTPAPSTNEHDDRPRPGVDRRPRVAVTRRSARQDAALRDLAESAAHPSPRLPVRRDVLFGRRAAAAPTTPSASDDDPSIALVLAAAEMSSTLRPDTTEPPRVSVAVVEAAPNATAPAEPQPPVAAAPQPAPERMPQPEPEAATFRTLLAPRAMAETATSPVGAPIGSGWSAPALRALGLPEGMVAAAAALAPRDDAEWTAALMLACRDRFEAVPNTPMLMAGPQLAAMASALRLPLVEPGDPVSAAYVALETDDPDEVLATLGGRDLHLVVGGSWQELARLRPVVVSAAGPRFMLQALSVAHAWGVPLGWMGGVESVRLDAVTLALEIRSALGLDLEEVRHRTS